MGSSNGSAKTEHQFSNHFVLSVEPRHRIAPVMGGIGDRLVAMENMSKSSSFAQVAQIENARRSVVILASLNLPESPGHEAHHLAVRSYHGSIFMCNDDCWCRVLAGVGIFI
jgi:hypothetical protein